MEHRIRDALSGVDTVEPSLDLWSRVSGSIEDDRARRRRIRVALTWILAAVGSLVSVGWLARVDTTVGRMAVEWRAMELIETTVLILLIAALGPAVRRFGDGYARAVFRAHPDTGARFIGLFDVAYYLVFSGYLLVTARFDAPLAAAVGVGEQLNEGTIRVGGLMLVMGLLHSVAFLVLPLVGLVFTAGWNQRRLPRWIQAVLVVLGLLAGLAFVQTLLGIIGMGVSG